MYARVVCKMGLLPVVGRPVSALHLGVHANANGHRSSSKTSEKHLDMRPGDLVEEEQPLHLLIGVGGEPQRRVRCQGLVKHSLLVRKRLKRIRPVVVAGTAGADAAKWHVRANRVHEALVETSTTRRRLLKHTLSNRFVLGKDVKRQWFVALVDKLNGLIDRVDCNHGQHRPKNLVFHDGRLEIRVDNHRGLNKVSVAVSLAAKYNLALGGFNQVLNALHVTRVDNAAEILACFWVIAVKLCDGTLKLVQEFLTTGAVHEDVIGSNACLSCIRVLGPSNAGCCNVEVHVFVNDARALSAELKKHRRQMLGSGTHDNLAHSAVARVHDLVKLFF
eukprot:m.479639 g.479639  ORF g.479639 m.479639 type:complete len:333 (-) comp21542_c0_seq1:837-1835(-)